MRLLNLVLIVGVCFAYHNIATIRAEKEAKIAAENSGSGSWKDGTYEGSGQGFGGGSDRCECNHKEWFHQQYSD